MMANWTPPIQALILHQHPLAEPDFSHLTSPTMPSKSWDLPGKWNLSRKQQFTPSTKPLNSKGSPISVSKTEFYTTPNQSLC